MKKLFYALIAVGLLLACNNKKSEEKTSGEKTGEKKTMDNITYPYTAAYSSDMALGDPNHSKIVLDMIKCWENNKMQDMRALLYDTVNCTFADGSKFSGSPDSLIKMGQMYRDMYTNVTIKLDAWMPVHLNDRNEDHVLVWERDYTTDKNGKIDSLASHAHYEIRNNKIAGWGEYQAKMTPPAEMNK